LWAIQSGAAVVDTLGYAGDVAGARAAHREVVEFVRGLWGQADFAGEVRLAALLLGRLADAAPLLPSREVADVLEEADRLADGAATIFAPGSPRPAPNTEGLAWAARARGERLRLRWRARAQVWPEELLAAWTEAVGLFETRGDPYETARSRAALAEVLAASGDREGAAKQARAARSTAAALRAAPLLARIDRSGVSGGGDGPSPSIRSAGLDAAASLTARELEVLTLVAQGRSNGQIGGELFISTKTASVHVSNILAKLGARTRGEAAALARDRGLLG
jgi:DNA-binding CsgD family transcriptional regulator